MKKIKKEASSISKIPSSSILMEIWEEMWVEAPCSNESLNINKYIDFFVAACSALRKKSNLLFSEINVPVCEILVQMSNLSDIYNELEWLLKATNNVSYECTKNYILNHKYRRILRRTQQKNEEIWDRFNKRLTVTESAFKGLYNPEETNYSAVEIPYKKDFSVILKNFDKFKN
jgi:hypothetical protein